jgi:hypothetical protein
LATGEIEKLKLYRSLIRIAAMKVGMMKAVTICFFMLMAAVAISVVDAASSSASAMNLPGREELLSFSPRAEANGMENKMTQAQSELDNLVHPGADAKDGGAFRSLKEELAAVSALYNRTLQKTVNKDSENKGSGNNSTVNSSSLNSSASSSTAINSSALNKSAIAEREGKGEDGNLRSGATSGSGAVPLSGNGSLSTDGLGASSKASVLGFYDISASRHEVGKSDIKSNTFLSGDFQVDKTVSFSDRGF